MGKRKSRDRANPTSAGKKILSHFAVRCESQLIVFVIGFLKTSM
jgi:hypothetical protein